jgi:hypothetical protein
LVKALRSLKNSEKKKLFLKAHMDRLQGKCRRKIQTIKIVNLDPNPDGSQYRPTPDDLILIERRKRFREKMESGWFGGMGNN